MPKYKEMGKAMKLAFEDLKSNSDQTIREVADRYGVACGALYKNAMYHELRFKRVKPRRNEEQRLATPAYKPLSFEEKQLMQRARVRLEEERRSAPVEVRMHRLMCDEFMKLANLWGDWVFK